MFSTLILASRVCARSQKIKTLERLERGWTISFDLIPFGITKETFAVILSERIGETSGDVGRLDLHIVFRPGSTRMAICLFFDRNLNCFDTSPLPLNKQVSIVVKHKQSLQDYKYYYSAHINNEMIGKKLNEHPKVFNNVNFYTDDPLYPTAKVLISDFKLVAYPHFSIIKK